MSNPFDLNVHNLDPSDPLTQAHDFLRALQQQQEQQQQLQQQLQQQQQQQQLHQNNRAPSIRHQDRSSIDQFGLLQPLSVQPFMSQANRAPMLHQANPLQPMSVFQANSNIIRTTEANLPLHLQPTLASHVSVSSNSSAVFGRAMTEKQQFLVFVKILLKYIDRTNDPHLRRTAKAVVAECTQRNRMGDAEYTPLQEAVERRLKMTIGEMHWTRAKLCFDTYLARQRIRTVTVSPPNPAAAATSISAV